MAFTMPCRRKANKWPATGMIVLDLSINWHNHHVNVQQQSKHIMSIDHGMH
jgi:hypothetical protein